MKKESKAVENYINDVIFKSWTWARLTEEERNMFLSCHFHSIKGNDRQRIEWLNSMYEAFLYALDYKPSGWREENQILF